MTIEEQKHIFAVNLTNLMEERGIKQTELAEAIGVSQQVLNSWVKEKSIPRIDKIQKLADYFGVQKTTLLDKQGYIPFALMERCSKLPPEKQKQLLQFLKFLEKN